MYRNTKQQFRRDFRVDQVENGFILLIGDDINTGGYAERFVFNSTIELTQFITSYIEEKV